MRELLRNSKIAHRLWLLAVLAVIGILVTNSILLWQTKSSLLEQKQLKTKHVVDVAYSLIEHYAGLARNGVLSQQDAQSAASRALAGLRYEDKEYFWINVSRLRDRQGPRRARRIHPSA